LFLSVNKIILLILILILFLTVIDSDQGKLEDYPASGQERPEEEQRVRRTVITGSVSHRRVTGLA
jgi:hypothetical protein